MLGPPHRRHVSLSRGLGESMWLLYLTESFLPDACVVILIREEPTTVLGPLPKRLGEDTVCTSFPLYSVVFSLDYIIDDYQVCFLLKIKLVPIFQMLKGGIRFFLFYSREECREASHKVVFCLHQIYPGFFNCVILLPVCLWQSSCG